jgi:hypothetical protein
MAPELSDELSFGLHLKHVCLGSKELIRQALHIICAFMDATFHKNSVPQEIYIPWSSPSSTVVSMLHVSDSMIPSSVLNPGVLKTKGGMDGRSSIVAWTPALGPKMTSVVCSQRGTIQNTHREYYIRYYTHIISYILQIYMYYILPVYQPSTK